MSDNRMKIDIPDDLKEIIRLDAERNGLKKAGQRARQVLFEHYQYHPNGNGEGGN